VLLVEDDRAVRGIVARMLEESGYTVIEASDGKEALRMYDAHQNDIHIIVSDLVMPEVSGRSLAEHITAAQPGVKVLLISGYPEETLDDLNLEGPVVAFLSKPFSPTTLARKIRDLVDNA